MRREVELGRAALVAAPTGEVYLRSEEPNKGETGTKNRPGHHMNHAPDQQH